MLIREILGEKEQTQRTNPNISNNGTFSYVYGLGNRSGHRLPCDQDNSTSRCQCGYSQPLMTQEGMDRWLNRILCQNHDFQPIFPASFNIVTSFGTRRIPNDSGMRQYYRCTKCDSVNT